MLISWKEIVLENLIELWKKKQDMNAMTWNLYKLSNLGM